MNEINGLNFTFWVRDMFWLEPPGTKGLGSYSKALLTSRSVGPF